MRQRPCIIKSAVCWMGRLMQDLSLGPLTIIRATHREMVAAAATGGFAAVGFRLIAPRPGDPVHPIEGGAGGVKDLHKVMDDNGVRLFDIESLWLSPVTQPESIRPALEICAALGGESVLVAGNDPDFERMVANFAQVAALASEFGLKVAVEPTSWCVISRLDQARELLSRASAGNGGILIDTLHMDRAGETPASLAALDPALVAYVQICDARKARPASPPELMAEARGDRLLPGEGALPLNEVLDALPPGIRIGVEAPIKEFADLSFNDAARRAGDATRAFFAARKTRNTTKP
ncbi:MAG: sugar phosphate isomerase/epimerase family protein [Pseudolabrys sp.]